MEDLNVQVLQGFRIRPKRIVKEKSYYICNTDKGFRVIRKCLDTKKHLLFQHEIKEQLCVLGQCNTDRYYLSAQDTPFFEYEDNIYIMTNLYDQRESNFGDNQDYQKVVITAAKFHKAARNLTITQPFYGNDNICETYKRQIVEIEGIKKNIGQKSRLSDFDVLFLKNYNDYIRQMRDALSLLSKTKLYEAKQSAKDQNAICHNLLKEEHLLIGEHAVYITGFSQTAVDYHIFDLCSIIQRYARNLPKPHHGIYDVLELYDKYHGLTHDDVEILYPLLKYPGKFVKICQQYYSKKRSWTPSAIINRIESIIASKEGYDTFVESLLRE